MRYFPLLLLLFCVFALTSAEVRHFDFYKTLNVPRNATSEQIKRSFRKMLLKYHPDKQGSQEMSKKAEKMMSLINEAYEILSDPDKRAELDATLDGTFVWYSATGRPIDGKYGFPIIYAIFVVVHYLYKYYRYRVTYDQAQKQLAMKIDEETKRLERYVKKEEKRLRQQSNSQSKSKGSKKNSVDVNEQIRTMKAKVAEQIEELSNTTIQLKGGVHFPRFKDCLIYKNMVFIPNIVMFFTRLIRYHVLGFRSYADVAFRIRQKFNLSRDAFDAYLESPYLQMMIMQDMGITEWEGTPPWEKEKEKDE
ncbi:hypothetical protein P9112_003939 [Eukaryota sp. TZLM1-RC]